MATKQRVLLLFGDFMYRRLLESVGLDVVIPRSLAECMRDDVNVVMFTGGADVHPKYYGGMHTNVSFVTEERDALEQKIFNYYLKKKVKMTGICRGLQIINVLAGGQMYQHISRHAGIYHNIIYPATKVVNEVTSSHHQLVILPKHAIPVAWAEPNRSDIFIGPHALKMAGPTYELEAAIYPNHNSFGVQFHPEMMRLDEEGCQYYRDVLTDFLRMNISEFIKLYGIKGVNNVDENKSNGRTASAGSGGINLLG